MTKKYTKTTAEGEGDHYKDLKARRRKLMEELQMIDRLMQPANLDKGRNLQPRIGGTFAPPLSDELLKEYRAAVEHSSPEVKDAIEKLLTCVEQWWDLPEPQHGVKNPHPSGTGNIVPLESSHAEQLDEVIPWDHELTAIQNLFDAIPAEQREVRNAAFHLLWHVKELSLGREPITSDKVV